VQIMYGLSGERLLREWDIPWLPGYENSKPVRVGNAAHGQMQIDVYGEVMDALHQARLGHLPESVDVWELQKGTCRASREGLAHSRSGNLGGPRQATALYALEDHGMGRRGSRR
jgi:GH15 family glucan-1,4-alpha-glucosidase